MISTTTLFEILDVIVQASLDVDCRFNMSFASPFPAGGPTIRLSDLSLAKSYRLRVSGMDRQLTEMVRMIIAGSRAVAAEPPPSSQNA